MSRTITFGGRDTKLDWKLLCPYPIIWLVHLVLGIAVLTGNLLPNDPESPLVVAWCALILVCIPIALAALRKTQRIELTEYGIAITATGMPFRSRLDIPRSRPIRLNLYSAGWGVCHHLVLHWGKLPWQSLALAPFATTDEKKAIGETVAAFLGEHQIPFTSNLLVSKDRI